MSESIGAIHYELDLKDEKFKGKVKNASGLMGGLKGSFESARQGSNLLLGSITALGVGLLSTAIKFTKFSGELEQNVGGSEAVFKKYSKDIQGYANEAYKNLGLSESQYLASANKMGALFQGAGFSVKDSMSMSAKAMQRAADVASIMGVDVNFAMESIAGAAKGNFTMMDNLGVAMNDTTIKNYALAKGIKTSSGQMTQQEKIGIAMKMFLDKTTYATGNYKKENDTLAGSLTTLKANMENVGASIGDSLAPFVTDLFNQFNAFLENDPVGFITSKLEEFEPVIYAVAGAIIIALLPALAGLAASIWATLAPLLPFIAIGALLGLGIYKLSEQFGGFDKVVGKVKEAINALWNIIGPLLMPALQQLWSAITNDLLPALQKMWNTIAPVLLPVLQFLAKVIGVVLFAAVMIVITAITTAVKVISGWINIWTSLIKNIKEKGIDGIKEWFRKLPGEIGNMLSGIAKAILAPFDGAFEKLKSKLKDIKNKIADALNPFVRHSPSLVDWVKMGAGTIEDTYTEMFDNLARISSQSRGAIAGSVRTISGATNDKGSSLSGGGITNVTIPLSGVITSSPGELRQVAVRLKEALDQALRAQGPNLDIKRI